MSDMDDVMKKFSGRQWYHQRFDGSPMFLFCIGEAETKQEDRKPAGTEADIRVCYFADGKADWYLDIDDINRGARVILDMAKENAKVSSVIMERWRDDEDRFEVFFLQEFPSILLHTLSTQELSALWKRYYALCMARFTSSAIIDHFALGTDQIVSDLLRKEVVEQSAGTSMKESGFVAIFSIATAPVRQSFINQAEIDLLKIATGESLESLEAYQKRYFWIKNNYVTAQVLGVEDFEAELRAWRESVKDLREATRQLEDTPRISREKKEALFKQYAFSEYLKTLFTISSDFSWWQDERKKATYMNIHIGSAILAELGKRIGYTLEELKYAVPAEIEPLITSGVPTRLTLQERKKNSVCIMTRDGYEVKTGTDVDMIRAIMLPKSDQKRVNDFRGLSASLGKVVGKVKIVNSATEISKVEEGDILVAVMTRPDYIVAMKRAAAIVTNEGGITSHAAIVSRELGIPCVIGTKIATEVLRDGDMVEVNANHGVITVLSRINH